MLGRFWTWTDSAVTPAVTGVPVGPLRFRAWTDQTGAISAVTGVPFGPLRFRAWTSGAGVVPPIITPISGGGFRIRYDDSNRARRLRDEKDIIEFILVALDTIN